jgi:hypothetical protein
MKLMRVETVMNFVVAVPDGMTHEQLMESQDLIDAMRNQLVTQEEFGHDGFVVELVEDIESLDDVPSELQDSETAVHGGLWFQEGNAKTLRDHFEAQDDK